MSERDAAVAALERVRAAVSGHPECDRYEEGDVISCGWKSAYASVVAALDGAPEPEDAWEYGLLNPQAPDGGKLRDGAHLISDNREHILKQQQRGHPSIQAVRRRKAGPWLPVEGESK